MDDFDRFWSSQNDKRLGYNKRATTLIYTSVVADIQNYFATSG
ncbi:MAG: hypothetical protein AAB632_03505 [Patescibacteria group bacterium]